MAKPPPSLTPARVVLAGYYGFGNVGDEALLYVLLGWLARYPLEPWVLSADPAGTRRRYGVRAVNRWSPPAVVRALRRADLLILGGGGLLQDATSRRSLLYYLGLLSLARLQGVPVMLIGQGIGPIRRRWLRMRTARALQGAVYLSVRDPESLAQLRAWGIGESRLALGPDPALSLSLSLDPDPLDSAAARPPTPRRTRPVLGVSPVPPPPDRREAVSTALASALDELQERLGMEVVFLPFHPRADLAFSLELARRLRRPATVLRLEEVNAPQALALVAECAVLWGARLHALEFALLAGVPFAGFLYDPKVSSFIRRLDSQTPESGRVGVGVGVGAGAGAGARAAPPLGVGRAGARRARRGHRAAVGAPGGAPARAA